MQNKLLIISLMILFLIPLLNNSEIIAGDCLCVSPNFPTPEKRDTCCMSSCAYRYVYQYPIACCTDDGSSEDCGQVETIWKEKWSTTGSCNNSTTYSCLTGLCDQSPSWSYTTHPRSGSNGCLESSLLSSQNILRQVCP